MAKKGDFTPEFLENLLIKLMDKFSEILRETLNRFLEVTVDQFTNKFQSISNSVESLTTKITVLEDKISSVSATSTSPEADKTVQLIAAMESERLDKQRRCRNVIITGIPPKEDVHDADVFEEFCELNLTVKPRPLRHSCRRLGKPTDPNLPTRLRITLENESDVDDLIESSRILRQSSDGQLRKIFFNRDLTPAEAHQAYEARCKRRSKNQNNAHHPASSAASNI